MFLVPHIFRVVFVVDYFCDFLVFSVRDAVRVDRFNVYQKLKLVKSKLKLAKSNPSRLD